MPVNPVEHISTGVLTAEFLKDYVSLTIVFVEGILGIGASVYICIHSPIIVVEDSPRLATTSRAGYVSNLDISPDSTFSLFVFSAVFLNCRLTSNSNTGIFSDNLPVVESTFNHLEDVFPSIQIAFLLRFIAPDY